MDPGNSLLLPPPPWIYGSRKTSATTPPPLNPSGQNSVCPPKWMLARTPMYTWRDSKLSDNTDIRQFNTLVIPTGTYGCEKCKITVRINNFKIDVFHHKCKWKILKIKYLERGGSRCWDTYLYDNISPCKACHHVGPEKCKTIESEI